MAQSSPTHPGLQRHLPVAASHAPFAGPEQLCKHGAPPPRRSSIARRAAAPIAISLSRASHDSPAQPGTQSQTPGATHSPWSWQSSAHSGSEQSKPPHPSSQRQTPGDAQVPRAEQLPAQTG